MFPIRTFPSSPKQCVLDTRLIFPTSPAVLAHLLSIWASQILKSSFWSFLSWDVSHSSLSTIAVLPQFNTEGYVISANQEFASIETFVEVFNRPDSRQLLLPRSTIVLLGFRKYPAEVLNDFLFLVLDLWQCTTPTPMLLASVIKMNIPDDWGYGQNRTRA